MQVSYKWLSSLVDLEGIEIAYLAKTITEAGLEVEEISYLAKATNLVIGQILECENHPDSDHLHVCKVSLGKEIVQIVCGAPNVRKGLKVIVAKEGAELPAMNVTIKKSQIRGVESNGMMCALQELGVADKYLSEEEKSGIHELDKDAPVGNEDPLAYLGLDDVLLEIKLTPNRGDCQSLYYLAKDIAAIMNRKVKVTFDNVKKHNGTKSTLTVNSLTDKCDYFSARKIKGIKIKKSPQWLEQALIGSGVRPINNIVDISNYLMLLFGQPIHMYDANKLKGNNYVIKNDMDLVAPTLDGNDIHIIPNDLVVTVADEAACLAGVMGMESTMIDENTKDIVIEVASFDGVSIRKTATRLQLFSDASARYIKGLDKKQFEKVMEYATSMVIDLADPQEIEEIAIYNKVNYQDKTVETSTKRINSLLGTAFSNEDIADVFKRLDFKYQLNNGEFKVAIPSYRNDISIEEDLVEEVIRIKGFDHINATLPSSTSLGGYNPTQLRKKNLREYLLSIGLNEVMTYTLTDENHASYFDVFSQNDEPLHLMSALGKDKEYLRKSILPSLVNTVSFNQARQNQDVNIFEIAKIYTEKGEYERLAIALSGKLNQTKWIENKESDYYTVKGIFESILEQLGIASSRVSYTPLEANKYFHPYRSALVSIDHKLVALLAEIHPNYLKEYHINKTVVAELDLKTLLEIKTSNTKFKKLPLYPYMERDIALVVRDDLSSEEIIRVIKKAGKDLVVKVTPFDEYKGSHIEKGYKSLAINIIYQDMNKTLTDQVINDLHKTIVEALVLQLNAQVR